jgi:hypothetical protein
MNAPGRLAFAIAACLTLASSPARLAQQGSDEKTDSKDGGRPRLTLRARPSVAATPARVVFTAELVGGANDFEEYYCPSVEWAWGDETTSESTYDCEPYEAGKSELRRRFTGEHTFRRPGTYKVYLRLKRGDKTVANTSVNVQVRPGARDFGY